MRTMSGIEVPYLREIDIDDRAAACRKRLAAGVGADEQVDMQQVLENIDGMEIPLPGGAQARVVFSVDKLPSHVYGLTSFHKEGSSIRVVFSDETYDAMERHGYARFTAPHEIGHVKLHLAQLINLTELPHTERALARANKFYPLPRDSEYQANRFAAAFMAPDDGLKLLDREGILDTDMVMSVFGMSRSAAGMRIRDYRNAVAQRAREARAKRRKGGR